MLEPDSRVNCPEEGLASLSLPVTDPDLISILPLTASVVVPVCNTAPPLDFSFATAAVFKVSAPLDELSLVPVETEIAPPLPLLSPVLSPASTVTLPPGF